LSPISTLRQDRNYPAVASYELGNVASLNSHAMKAQRRRII